MTRSLTVLASMLFVASACAPAPAPAPAAPPDTSAADLAAITNLRNAYVAAYNSNDPARFAGLVTEDVVDYSNERPASAGKAAHQAYLTGLMSEMTMSNAAITPSKTTLMGNYATEEGEVTATLTPKAKGAAPMPLKVRYIVILQKQADGTYKLWRAMDNVAAPPAAAPHK